MTQMEIGQTCFFVHPFTWVLALLMVLLGQGETLLAYSIALLVHEAGHYMPTISFRCQPQRMEITPFGAMAAVEEYQAIKPSRQFLIALCGPLANLLLLLVLMSLFYLDIISSWMVSLFKANLLLMLFNLMPVLPLDGGRMLQSLLNRKTDWRKSSRILAGIGMAFGAGIVLLALAGVIMLGTLNLSLVITGVYLIYAAGKTKQSALTQYLHHVIGARAKLEKNGVVPYHFVAVSSGLTVRELMEKLPLGQHNRMIVIDEKTLNEIGEIKQADFEKAIISNPNEQVENLI